MQAREENDAFEGVSEVCCAKVLRKLKGGNVRDGESGGKQDGSESTNAGPRVKRWPHVSRGRGYQLTYGNKNNDMWISSQIRRKMTRATNTIIMPASII